jgi:phospholipid/cholesterol/gamma-HCH transport system permease protein
MSHRSVPPELLWKPQADAVMLRLAGGWTLEHHARLKQLAESSASPGQPAVAPDSLKPWQLDLADIAELDTAGADKLCRILGPALPAYLNSPYCTLSPAQAALLKTVAAARASIGQQTVSAAVPAWRELLERIGLSMLDTTRQIGALLAFTGLILETLGRTIGQPRTWRVTSLVAQIEASALNAVPIVALLTFMVGAVIAFLGATILASFGASIYTVNLVTFSFLREFAVLLTAILVAGRTASAFTAQIGAMKVNEEIDAIRMLGLDPVQLLVLPRVLALLVAVPCLTLVGMASGILGGALVCVFTLDITPTMFLSIFQERIPLRHFLIGLAKAPFFAFAIAIIGCHEGFRVSGSAQSVGQRTTSAVVQSIFVVILLDALAALFFMEMGW